MAKPKSRARSRYSRDAVRLLGRLIRRARIEQGLTEAELAERAGVSRGLVQRAERGEPGCSVGAVFELAAIVGVPLFQPEPMEVRRQLAETERYLRLLPAAVHTRDAELKDDF